MIFEPQVVSHPLVTKISLCATGIPASGCAPPFAMRSSAVCACARLFCASTVMNALSAGLSFSIRFRKSFVSSTLEIFFCASAAASSLSEAFSTRHPPRLHPSQALLNDFRNEIQTRFDLRRHRLELLPLVPLGHFILAQTQRRSMSVRHRLDTLGVDLLHSPDQFEDVVQLALDGPGFRVADADSGQLRYAADFVYGQRHEKSLRAEIYLLYYSAFENPLS